MRRTLIFSVVSLLVFTQTYAVAPVSTLPIKDIKQNNLTITYDVRIKFVHSDGSPVTNIGLRGGWARNEQTGVYYDPTDQEGYTFEGLPAGTYTFGAYPGYWEGAVSKTVTLDPSQEGPDGFIEVTLHYWVE